MTINIELMFTPPGRSEESSAELNPWEAPTCPNPSRDRVLSAGSHNCRQGRNKQTPGNRKVSQIIDAQAKLCFVKTPLCLFLGASLALRP